MGWRRKLGLILVASTSRLICLRGSFANELLVAIPWYVMPTLHRPLLAAVCWAVTTGIITGASEHTGVLACFVHPHAPLTIMARLPCRGLVRTERYTP